MNVKPEVALLNSVSYRLETAIDAAGFLKKAPSPKNLTGFSFGGDRGAIKARINEAIGTKWLPGTVTGDLHEATYISDAISESTRDSLLEALDSARERLRTHTDPRVDGTRVAAQNVDRAVEGLRAVQERIDTLAATI